MAAMPPPGTTKASRSSRDDPPREGASKRADSPKKESAPRAPATPALTAKWKPLHTAVEGMYQNLGGAVVMFGGESYQEDGLNIINNSSDLADAWIDLAKNNKKVEEMLTRLTTGSAFGGLVISHFAILAPMALRHGWLPDGFPFGGIKKVDPEPVAADTAGVNPVDPPSFPQAG